MEKNYVYQLVEIYYDEDCHERERVAEEYKNFIFEDMPSLVKKLKSTNREVALIPMWKDPAIFINTSKEKIYKKFDSLKEGDFLYVGYNEKTGLDYTATVGDVDTWKEEYLEYLLDYPIDYNYGEDIGSLDIYHYWVKRLELA